nr:polymorphic toxin-type HINT domain-containing protein [Nostoc sp. ChiQUE02]MDZ8234714.1 polymorphic toxin-type HINT domain-containing protein [Nostoc sp. ChiQUE02]
MFGEWGAGFASGVSGGFLTDVYEFTTGQKIEPKHAMLYNAGNVTGIGVSFLTGMQAATWAKTGVGPLKWVAAVNTGLDVYGAAKATSNLYQSYQDNGKFERKDLWNLLAYVPFAGALLGTKKFFAANKAINTATESANELLKTPGKAITETGNCFVAGTEIITAEGIKNIEDIQVGDWVIVDDPTTPGEIEARQVLDTFVSETTALVDLYVDGEVISTTGEHPFWTSDKGWVKAKDLQVGSLLQTEDGRIIDVDRIEKREGEFEVYNFRVEGIPTYFVSELGILVHNICVYTTTNSRVDLNRPEGTFVTFEDLTNFRTLYNHISNNVPPTSRRAKQYFLDFVTEIDVPEEALLLDPHRLIGPTRFIPPNTNGARITREWSVTEPVIGEPPVYKLLD